MKEIKDEIAKRRSSILKPNRNLENGGSSGDVSPTLARRVSFAENMKVKTFDETGCNTSELVPHATDMSGSRDMSLVDTTGNCEKNYLNFVTEEELKDPVNMSVVMEISQEDKSISDFKTKTHIHIAASCQRITTAQKTELIKDNGATNDVNSDDDGDDMTGEVLIQMAAKAIGASNLGKGKLAEESISDDMTADILRKLSTSVAVRNLRNIDADDGTAMFKSGVDASELQDETMLAPVSNETRNELDKWQQKRHNGAKKAGQLQKFATDFQKEVADWIDQLNKRPLAKYLPK